MKVQAAWITQPGRYEEIICITEGKQSDIVAGFVQNIMQCGSAINANTKLGKRKRGGDNYVLGILKYGN